MLEGLGGTSRILSLTSGPVELREELKLQKNLLRRNVGLEDEDIVVRGRLPGAVAEAQSEERGRKMATMVRVLEENSGT